MAVLVIGMVGITGILSGGRLIYFLSVPSFIVVVLPAVLLTLGNFSLREMISAYAIGFKSGSVTRVNLEKARLVHAAMGKYLIASGVIGTMIGVIVMLGNLGDASAVGQGFAVSLITVLYAVVFYTIFVVPFQTGIQRRLAEHDLEL
jgi:flagellar motor component MotA